MPDIAAVVGVNAGRVRGLSFVRSSPETRQHPYPPCVPRLVSPEDRGDYEVVELTHRELDSTVALDVNEQGTVLGSGTRPGQPGVHVMSLWERNGSGELLSFTGSAGPRGLSQRGEICATADMTDGSVHATRWFPGQPPEDLGTIHGTESDEFADSGASAINNLGGVAGWVSLSSDPQDRGQGNYRPAVWIPADGPIFLTDFAFAWGQGIDINDDGTVLVVAYTEGIMGKTKALLWNPVEGRLDPVGGDEPDGVYPMGLTSDGIILGNAAGRSGERIASVSTDSGPWARLGTPEGWYATTMDNSRSVTGSVNIGGFERPWLRRPNGDVLWLPYFDHHYCRPNSMTDTGLVAGTAQTDHGTHALFWRSENS